MSSYELIEWRFTYIFKLFETFYEERINALGLEYFNVLVEDTQNSPKVDPAAGTSWRIGMLGEVLFIFNIIIEIFDRVWDTYPLIDCKICGFNNEPRNFCPIFMEAYLLP